MGAARGRSVLVEGHNGKVPVPARQLVPACVVGTAVFIGACMTWAVPHVEHGIERAARHDLEQAGIDPSSVTLDVDFRSVTVSDLPAGVTAADVTAALAHTDGIRTVSVEDTP